MRKKHSAYSILFVLLTSSMAFNASAGIINWANWTSATSSTATGNLTIGAQTVGISYSGNGMTSQLNNTGTNYWAPSSPYISATVSNAPGTVDILQLATGGTDTINFSTPVVNPVLALVSWNNNIVDFGTPITLLSSGTGFWGPGTFSMTATGFSGTGELHGVIQLPGTFSSISFTHLSEGWHGITVGTQSLAAVPLPASFLTLLLGMPLLVWFGKHRKTIL